MDAYLTVSELAGLLKLQKQTIRRYIGKKAIPYCKILRAVRFRPSDIEKWINDGGLEAAMKSERKKKEKEGNAKLSARTDEGVDEINVTRRAPSECNTAGNDGGGKNDGL